MNLFYNGNPALVAQINLSNTINIAGRINATTIRLIRAPLARSIHKELIISILEYNPTPNVAAKKLNALTMTDCKELSNAVLIASRFSAPWFLALLYLFVIKNCVVNGCTELDRSDYDRSDKRKNRIRYNAGYPC